MRNSVTSHLLSCMCMYGTYNGRGACMGKYGLYSAYKYYGLARQFLIFICQCQIVRLSLLARPGDGIELTAFDRRAKGFITSLQQNISFPASCATFRFPVLNSGFKSLPSGVICRVDSRGPKCAIISTQPISGGFAHETLKLYTLYPPYAS